MILWVIDRIEKLHTEKDSTFFLAHLYQKQGIECRFTYEVRLNKNVAECDSFELDIVMDEKTFVQNKVTRKGDAKTTRLLDYKTVFNRLEPPVDERYMLQAKLMMLHPRVINSPVAVQAYSEKLIPIYFGEGIESSTHLEVASHEGVIKPLDGFGGTGVAKIKKGEKIPQGSILQPYNEDIEKGEKRYFVVGNEVFGELLKSKPANDFRTNSVYGSTLTYVTPDEGLLERTREVAKKLNAIGVQLAVVDFIGTQIVEINITCPSLWNRIYAGMDDGMRMRLEGLCLSLMVVLT